MRYQPITTRNEWANAAPSQSRESKWAGHLPSTDGCLFPAAGRGFTLPSLNVERVAAWHVFRRRGTELGFLPVVEVVLFIFTVAAVSVVFYIFFLRHRCCLILIRHLYPGSEKLPRVADAFKPASVLLALRCLRLFPSSHSRNTWSRRSSYDPGFKCQTETSLLDHTNFNIYKNWSQPSPLYTHTHARDLSHVIYLA